MSENIITVSELFTLDVEQAPGPRSQQDWREKLGKRLDEELKGIKWPTALPDIAEKLAELLNLPLPTLFFGAWKKLESVQAALKETRERPGEKRSIFLGEHTIETLWEPAIDVRLWKVMPLPKILKFPVKLEGKFLSLDLQIENGAIAGISGCKCEVAGTLSLGTTRLVEKNFGTIEIVGALFDDQTDATSLVPSMSDTG